MQITIQLKLQLTKEQTQWLKETSKEYIRLVNQVVADWVGGSQVKHSSRTVSAALPSAVKNQALQNAKSVYRKIIKTNIPTILRKPVCIWNNQNWKLKDGVISFPLWIEGKSKRVAVPVKITEYQEKKLIGKTGTLRITEKSRKWIAQIAVSGLETGLSGTGVMGIDLGLKVPAVAVTDTGKTKFFGNGRQNKYMKRKNRSKRRKLGKLKKLSAIRKLNNKEQRWMKDQDHKVSRQIINMAIQEKVGVIRLEKLSGIRQTARTSRKNEKNLHSWSFYRLSQFLEYKAALAGIRIEYVDPKYTSQKCPKCGSLNKVKDRDYQCGCGYHTHRDRLGALNIMHAPVADGNSLSA
ncbi:transposase [Paenibacillus oralis]|uniref:Transposase n=1 Tax=Paenibacillus oralis TaxID=2490856 RepID=A0A3P3TB17_9BACL|nr:RNA-guided endonuclease TnpB family protein [Paenibacillus oralis]RRJ54719.1 transposase [Paenibacillus oralis]